MIPEPTSILICESHTLYRQALSTTLESENAFAVLGELADFSLVVPIVEKEKPDLVMLSVGNPGEEGYATIENLRRTNPDTRIVALVSGEVPNEEQIAKEHGAHLAINKSASRQQLLAELKDFLGAGFTSSK